MLPALAALRAPYALRRPARIAPPWILIAAVTGAALDLAVAVGFWHAEGVPMLQPLQHIAAWWLGEEAFNGGIRTALLGAAAHFVLLWGFAHGYLALARKYARVAATPMRGGMVFGAVMYVSVFHVAVPLFAVEGVAPHRLDWIVVCLAACMALIGVPCAWAAQRVLAR